LKDQYRPIDKNVVGGIGFSVPVLETSYRRAITKHGRKAPGMSPLSWLSLRGGDFYDDGIQTFVSLIDSCSSLCSSCVHGNSWRVLDVSVAMAYSMLNVYGKKNQSISAAAALLRGYNSVHPLMEVERRHLILLITCRLACSVTLGAYSIQQNPGNEYLLLHATPAWNALDLLWGTDPVKRQSVAEVIDRVFDLACSESKTDPTSEIIDCSDLAFPDPCVADLLLSVRVSNVEEDCKERPTKQRKNH
jgi:hypothetical protein